MPADTVVCDDTATGPLGPGPGPGMMDERLVDVEMVVKVGMVTVDTTKPAGGMLGVGAAIPVLTGTSTVEID